jgi:hypothetical protein
MEPPSIPEPISELREVQRARSGRRGSGSKLRSPRGRATSLQGNYSSGIQSPTNILTEQRSENSKDLFIGELDNTELDINPDVRLARFQMVDEFGATKSSVISEVAFVGKASKPISSKQLLEIVVGKWGLKPANMMINIDGGSMHPKAFATTKLSSQPQFNEWMAQSLAQLKMTIRAEDNIDLNDPSVLAMHTNKVINLLIFQRLQTVFSAILDAAFLSNNWILINRAGSQGSSATAELVVEWAMSLASQRPVVIVIDSFNRFESFDNQGAVDAKIQLHYLQDQCVDMDSYDRSEYERE